MANRKLRIIIALLILSWHPATSQNFDAGYLDGQLYLKVKSSFSGAPLSLGSPELKPLLSQYSIDTIYPPFTDLDNDTLNETYYIHFSAITNTGKLMGALRALPLADYVEQIPLYRTSFIPNDIDTDEYALRLIEAERGWDISKGSSNLVIAIIDNAILSNHEDLVANMVPGYDVADNDNNTAPPPGFSNLGWCHGTHCSGIASGVTNNHLGIASIGYNTHLMPIKATYDTVASGDVIYFPDKGIAYAITHGANVLSLSWGGYGASLTEQVIINAALQRNIVVVAAAGNSDSSEAYFPSAYKGVICVGATDRNDVRASFSNYGRRIDVMAPGVHIFSTFAQTTSAYANFSGTSMSCPMVAGLAALVMAQNPTYTPDQVKAAIKTGADDISAKNPGFSHYLGAGRINAYKTLNEVTQITIDGGNENVQLRAFPNPFSSSIKLEMTADLFPATIQLMDVQGQIVMSQALTGESANTIETSRLQKGIYVLRVIGQKGISNQRLIKM